MQNDNEEGSMAMIRRPYNQQKNDLIMKGGA
jgi:hypothetical protein